VRRGPSPDGGAAERVGEGKGEQTSNAILQLSSSATDRREKSETIRERERESEREREEGKGRREKDKREIPKGWHAGGGGGGVEAGSERVSRSDLSNFISRS